MKFKVILADNPWEYSNKRTGGSLVSGADEKYNTLSLDELCNLPVKEVADKNSVLFLWVTTPLKYEIAQSGLVDNWGFCVGVGTKILTRDLKWVKAETLKVGDKLIGFDDTPVKTYKSSLNNRRYYRESIVVSTGIELADVWAVELEDGRVLTCTPDHKWLGVADHGHKNIGWITTKDIPKIMNHSSRKKPIEFCNLLPLNNFIEDYKHGYLAGAFDGEGSLILKRRGHAGSPKLSLAQNDNEMLKYIEKYLSDCNYKYDKYDLYKNKSCHHVNIRGGWLDTMKLLMETRPKKLLQKWCDSDISSSLYNMGRVNVVDAYPVGIKPIVTLQTSTGTYIADGLGAHNTYKTTIYWRKIMSLGLGFNFRGQVEECWMCTRGKVKPFRTQLPNIIESKVRKHSQKPEEFFQMIEPSLEKFNLNPRLEMFARNVRSGWHSIGNEITGNDIRVDLRKLISYDYLS